MEKEFNIGDPVMVRADCTGFGRPYKGVVTDKEHFLGIDIYSVDYTEPAPYGCKGITVSNPGMLIPINTYTMIREKIYRRSDLRHGICSKCGEETDLLLDTGDSEETCVDCIEAEIFYRQTMKGI